jgi:hypothetical protein
VSSYYIKTSENALYGLTVLWHVPFPTLKLKTTL